MYTLRQKEQYEYRRKIVCERLGFDLRHYNEFRRLSVRLHELYLQECIGFGINNNSEIIKLVIEGTELAKKLELELFFNPDPVTLPMFLSKIELDDENFWQYGYCIY